VPERSGLRIRARCGVESGFAVVIFFPVRDVFELRIGMIGEVLLPHVVSCWKGSGGEEPA